MNQSASVLHIGKDNPNNNYMMGHTPLQVLEKERDLGLVVSAGDTLCCEEQLRGMIGKAKKMTSWIIRNVVHPVSTLPSDALIRKVGTATLYHVFLVCIQVVRRPCWCTKQ